MSGEARAMIRYEGVTKKYRNLVAVDNLNLEIPSGALFGLLGPNGAGKTTSIRMLVGLLAPTQGRIELGGYDVVRRSQQAKSILGYIPDRPFIYEKLTAREFLRFIADVYRIDGAEFETRSAQLLELFELSQWAEELVESFSHGMKQRLVFAGALIHRPRVLVVDEPMVGLDPKGIRLIKDVFETLRGRGVTILMSTHTLEQAQSMCDEIGIINKGQLIAKGTMDVLQQTAETDIPAGRELEAIFLRLTGEQEIGDALEEVV